MVEWLLFLFAVVAALGGRRWRFGASYGFFVAVFVVGGAAAAVTSQDTIDFMLAHHLDPFPQFTFLLGSWLSVVAAFCVLSMLSYSLSPHAGAARRRTIRHLALLLGCGSVMTVLVLAMRPAPVADFLATYGEDWRAVAFVILYAGYIAMAASEFIVLVLRYLRTGRPSKQVVISLRLEIIGAGLTLVWCAWWVMRAIADARYSGAVVNAPVMTESLTGAIIAFMAVGAAWGVWAIKAADAWAQWWVWRLTPIWDQLRPTGDEYVLRLDGHEPIDFVLHRRLVEIRDWQFRLRAYVHPDLDRWVDELVTPKRLTAEEKSTVREAAEIVTALESGARRDAVPTSEVSALPGTPSARHGQRAEVRALYRIATLTGMSRWPSPLAWRTRSLVRQISNRARNSADVTEPSTNRHPSAS